MPSINFFFLLYLHKKTQARARINQKSLKYVLYLLGYTDEDAKQLYSVDN